MKKKPITEIYRDVYNNLAQLRVQERLLDEARGGHAEMVEEMLKAGARPDAQDNRALFAAVCNNHPRVVEVLLTYGANPDGMFGLIHLHSREKGYDEITQLLRDHSLARAATMNRPHKSRNQSRNL